MDGRQFLTRRPHRTGPNITVILLEAGVVTEEQVEQGVLRQRETGLRIGETLVQSGAVTEEDVGWALSRQLSLTLVDIEATSLDAELVRTFNETLLRRSDAIPLLREEAGVSFAVADPTDQEMLDRLEEATGGPIGLCIGTPTAIRRGLDAIFGGAHAITLAGVPAVPDGRYDVLWERSGATFMAFHLTSALKAGATEAHFMARDGQLFVAYRQGERLVQVATEPEQVLEALVGRLEALGGPVLGKRIHAAGSVECSLPMGELLVEVSVLRSREGVSVTLRPRPKTDRVPSLEDLGFDAVEAAELRSLVSLRAGLVLVCGPRGTECSSVLAALLAAAQPGDARILAFEPAGIVPLPGASRILVAPGESHVEWQEIVTEQSADIVILDGMLDGSDVDAVLSPAGSGRLLLARSNWIDSFTLIEHLTEQPQGPPILMSRLLAMVQIRRAGNDVLPLVETLIPGPALWEAVSAGATRSRLIEVARADGFRSLVERAHDRLSNGSMNERECRRALT